MNQMGPGILLNERGQALVDAIYSVNGAPIRCWRLSLSILSRRTAAGLSCKQNARRACDVSPFREWVLTIVALVSLRMLGLVVFPTWTASPQRS